jgi:acyl-CoA dehydrogenase
MDFEESHEEAATRADVRAWLADNAPEPPASGAAPITLFAEPEDELAEVERARTWQAALAEGGWAAVSWPPEYGGRGASLVDTMIVQEELARYGVPQRICGIGIGLLGPTLIAHGTDAQKQRYLLPMLRGEEVWCQLWSEPGAGSDLGSLRTRADGGDGGWVLNGQKVWTSGAHYSQFGLGIFRTDWEAPKHKGISCFVIDMSSPGITIRPLRQITGGANFNEVFFDDVFVPQEDLVGDLNDGWRVARTTLMNERFAAGGATSPVAAFPALVELARRPRRGGAVPSADPLLRQQLARVYTAGRLFDLTNARVRTSLLRGQIPGPEGSILKLAVSNVWTEQAELALDVLGAHGMLADGSSPEGGRWQDAFLGAPAVHIGGGTDNIQRNLIAEHVLGLPRDLAPDRDQPFRDLAGG